LKNQSYSVFRVNLSVTGTFAQLSDFLNRLEKEKPETLVVEYLSVARETEPPAGGKENEDVVPVGTSLRIDIYSLPPAAD
jgi:hypothetical protein